MANSFQTIELDIATSGVKAISRAEGGTFNITPGDSPATVLGAAGAVHGAALVGVSGNAANRVYAFSFNAVVGAMTTMSSGVTIAPTYFTTPTPSENAPEFGRTFEAPLVLEPPTSARSFESPLARDGLEFGRAFEAPLVTEPSYHPRGFDSPPVTPGLEFRRTFDSGAREPAVVVGGGNTGPARPSVGWQFPLD